MRILCQKCGRNIIASCFDAHMNLHTGKRPFRCSICPKAYPSRKSLSRHVFVQHGTRLGDIKCRTDPEADAATDPEASVLTISEASTRTSKARPKVSTSVPDVKSNQPTLVTAENNSKMVVSIPIHVKVCINTSRSISDTGSTNSAVVSQMSRNDSNATTLSNKESFKCSHCDKVYSRRKTLNKHLKVKHKHNTSPNTVCPKKRFQCSECEKFYNWKHNLVEHCQNKHSDVGCDPSQPKSNPKLKSKPSISNWKKKPDFPCCCCDLTFDSLLEYKTHLFSHSTKPVRNILCSVCGRRFHTLKMLWVHQRQTHHQYQMSFYKRLETNHWGNTKKGSHSVKKSMHKEPNTKNVQQKKNLSSNDSSPSSSQSVSLEPLLVSRGYKCRLCGKVITHLCHFREHINLHTGECTISCQYCNKSFTTYYRRRAHIKTEHPEIKQKKRTKPLSKESKQNQRLGVDMDMLIQSTCTPDMIKEGHFSCQQCEKSFQQFSKFKEHIFFCHPPSRPTKHMKLRSDEDQPLWQGFHIDTYDRITYDSAHKPSLESKIDKRESVAHTKCSAKGTAEIDCTLPVDEAGNDAMFNNHTVHDLESDKTVLPVFGEIKVKDKKIVSSYNENQQNVYAVSSDCVMKKHGSWNVFYFTNDFTS